MVISLTLGQTGGKKNTEQRSCEKAQGRNIVLGLEKILKIVYSNGFLTVLHEARVLKWDVRKRDWPLTS